MSAPAPAPEGGGVNQRPELAPEVLPSAAAEEGGGNQRPAAPAEAEAEESGVLSEEQLGLLLQDETVQR